MEVNDDAGRDSEKTAVYFSRGNAQPQQLHLGSGGGRDIHHAPQRHGESQRYFPDERRRTLESAPENKAAAPGTKLRTDSRGRRENFAGRAPECP